MVDQSRRLHILLGLKRKDEINHVYVYVFKSDAVYNFDADGVSIGPGLYGNRVFIAWKDNELRLYVYSDEQAYKMWDKGANITVEPLVYTLPEKIVRVNPYLDHNYNFIVVTTDEGTYLVPNPSGHYSDDRNIYRIFGKNEFVGGVHYWGIGDLIVYSGGKLYKLEADYSESKRKMEVTIESTISVPNVVGLYGEYDHESENNILLSLSDGTLLAYTYKWDDTIKGYTFKQLKTFNLGIPLKAFYSDFRPGNGLLALRGLGSNGHFYLFDARS